jgi:hypothetical protein
MSPPTQSADSLFRHLQETLPIPQAPTNFSRRGIKKVLENEAYQAKASVRQATTPTKRNNSDASGLSELGYLGFATLRFTNFEENSGFLFLALVAKTGPLVRPHELNQIGHKTAATLTG